MPLLSTDALGDARRIHVVGTSGSGKTWLGSRLAQARGVPFVDLDAIYHQPNWEPLPEGPFVEQVDEATAGDGWVVAGNYARARPVVWPKVDVIVWLDLPRRVVFPAVLGRTVKRAITREELWNGNRERWSALFSPDRKENVVLWSWLSYNDKRREYLAASVDLPVVRLGSRREMGAIV